MFIERMLHSISSKSPVLPYGKYRGRPTPLPPTPAQRESTCPTGKGKTFKSRKIPTKTRLESWST